MVDPTPVAGATGVPARQPDAALPERPDDPPGRFPVRASPTCSTLPSNG
jgi:hypothetical protein